MIMKDIYYRWVKIVKKYKNKDNVYVLPYEEKLEFF